MLYLIHIIVIHVITVLLAPGFVHFPLKTYIISYKILLYIFYLFPPFSFFLLPLKIPFDHFIFYNDDLHGNP